MKSDLDELIAQLESEKQLLQTAIDASVKDAEYLCAHHNFQALGWVSEQLRLLHRLKDPLHPEKESALRMLDMYTQIELKVDEWDKDDIYLQWRQKQFAELTARLDELNQQKSDLYDSQEIDNALFDLYEGKLAGFRLYLNQRENLWFNFTLNEKYNLVISINRDIAVKKFSYHIDDPLLVFKIMGFRPDDINSTLYYVYEKKPFKNATPVKKLLSRIIYKLFNTAIEAPFIEILYR